MTALVNLDALDAVLDQLEVPAGSSSPISMVDAIDGIATALVALQLILHGVA